MHKVFQTLDYDFPITLEQSQATNLFKVTYGGQVTYGLTYEQAAKELGECLMHAFTCSGAVATEWEATA